MRACWPPLCHAHRKQAHAVKGPCMGTPDHGQALVGDSEVHWQQDAHGMPCKSAQVQQQADAHMSTHGS